MGIDGADQRKDCIIETMQTPSSETSRLASWFKKNTEGTLLMQWISYFMIFSVLVIFILEYPTQGKLDWRFFGTVLALGVLLVINILWFQYHEQQFFRQHVLFYHWAFNIVTTLLVLVAFAFTGRSEIDFPVVNAGCPIFQHIRGLAERGDLFA